MHQKKCVHQSVTRLGKYVPQRMPTHVETIALLQKSNRISKPDTYVKLSLDMEDYYRIKDAEGGATIEPFSGKFCKSIKNIN
nr:hypothetical protein [uncultured Blautia sp.]